MLFLFRCLDCPAATGASSFHGWHIRVCTSSSRAPFIHPALGTFCTLQGFKAKNHRINASRTRFFASAPRSSRSSAPHECARYRRGYLTIAARL
jgi:hypothetical protein